MATTPLARVQRWRSPVLRARRDDGAMGALRLRVAFTGARKDEKGAFRSSRCRNRLRGRMARWCVIAHFDDGWRCWRPLRIHGRANG